MTKVLVAFLLITFLFISSFSFEKHNSLQNQEPPLGVEADQVSPIQTPVSKLTISDYWFDWILIENINRVDLKTNLIEKLSSEVVREEYSCDQLISGGFYNQEGKHIGLFITEYEEISSFQESSIFNSFFSVDENGKAEISYSQPRRVRLGLQAGPMLLKNGQLVNLQLKSDSKARRIILATDKDNSLIFMAIYDKDSLYLGPQLSELPLLLERFAELEDMELVDAMNLDGGSHSAFITSEVKLTELSTIGSFFCIAE